jgi:hypothetical protein
MDLVFMAAVVALSFYLALAGARVVLWSVFCLMMHPIRMSHVATGAMRSPTPREQRASTSIAA